MQKLAVIEIEEGTLTLTFGVRVGAAVHVTRAVRVAVPEGGREVLTNVLRPLANDVQQEGAAVHVILGDRRTQHFVGVLPRLPAAEVAAWAVRESLRLTSMPGPGEVLVALRSIRNLKGGRMVVGVTALPRNVWEPWREAFRACNLEVLGLHSSEACLAAGGFAALRRAGRATTEAAAVERFAVLECGAGRARFVLCDGKSAAQVRRFLVGTSESNPEALATHLSMELPRTLDWLRESGQQVPSVLVLGHRIDVQEDSVAMIRGDLQHVLRAGTVESTGEVVPSLATTALLKELARGAPPSLLAAPVLQLPRSPWWRLTLPLVAVAGGLCSMVALQQYGATLQLRDRIAESKDERAALRQQFAAADVDVAEPAESEARAHQLALAVGTRRPASRVVAEISNVTSGELLLDGMQFASNERVVVTGVVRGESRSAALAALADFADRVRALRYFDSDGQEDVIEVAGQPNQFRFRLAMAWRQS